MRALLALIAIASAASLSSHLKSTPQQQWRTERRTSGDTTIVRTVGAPQNAAMRKLVSVLTIGREDGPKEYIFGVISEIRRAPDGSILVFDRQASALRKYDSTGRFVRNVGRSGRGPGEHTVVSGVAVSARGNIVLWDNARSQIHLFSSSGEYSNSLALPRPFGIQSTGGRNASIDSSGNIYVRKGELAAASGTAGVAGPATISSVLVKLAPDGSILDTMKLPAYGISSPIIERRGTGAGGGPAVVRAPLPFFPNGSWALSPHGYFVASHGEPYAVDLLLPRGRVTRIERDVAPVPVASPERDNAITVLEARVRRADANYRFNGPTIPSTRPAINGLLVDEDGRVWVSVAMPGERIPDAGPVTAGPPPVPPPPGIKTSAWRGAGGASGSISPDWQVTHAALFRAPTAYDVFATAGNFLGRVLMPNGVTPDIIKGDYLWAVTRDSLDVQHVVKFRIEPSLGR